MFFFGNKYWNIQYTQKVLGVELIYITEGMARKLWEDI